MLKKKNVDESIYHEDRVRFVTEEFSGLGINGHVNDVFVIAANVPAPPCLLQNSEHYDGPAPFNVIRYDAAAHASYTRANTPRVEPKPAITLMLTAPEVCAELGWSKSDLDVACASGLKADGWREVKGDNDISIGLQPLFSPETLTRFIARIKALPVGAR